MDDGSQCRNCNFKTGLLGKFIYLYEGALGGLGHFPELYWHRCHNVRMWWERESCGAIDQHHRSLNWGSWEKEWTAFSCDLRSSVCGIGFDFSALVTNRSKSEKQPEMWPWNNTTHVHSNSRRQVPMIFQTLCQGCPFSIYCSIFFLLHCSRHGSLVTSHRYKLLVKHIEQGFSTFLMQLI